MKAILLIDEMPKDCGTCPCAGEEYGDCQAVDNERACDWYTRPAWCPLKPMPKPINPVIARQCKQDEPLYQEGWNDCLEEIEE